MVELKKLNKTIINIKKYQHQKLKKLQLARISGNTIKLKKRVITVCFNDTLRVNNVFDK